MLERVTITGADDSTDLNWMMDMSEQYPFVEWGILKSQSQEDSYRFPSSDWIVSLLGSTSPKKINLKLSTHLCGLWVRELLRGELEWSSVLGVSLSQRIQINTHAQRVVSTSSFVDKLAEVKDVQFIFQWDGVNDHLIYAAKACGLNVAALFDTSGGAGILPDKWPMPASEFPCGYAGGLGPDNVAGQIRKIEAVCKKPFWIDMERRVRSEDDSRLDVSKVESVLEQCAPFVVPAAVSK